MARIEHSRPLTPGERGIATRVFGGALDLDRVTLRRGKWFPFQPRAVTMAPDGHVWFHPRGGEWRDDFATAGLASRALLVHELTHVWQHQQEVNLVVRRYPLMRYAYLPLTPSKPFAAYNLEQQACIVADAYLLDAGARVPGAPPPAAYAALIPFAPTSDRRGAAGAGSGSGRSPATS